MRKLQIFALLLAALAGSVSAQTPSGAYSSPSNSSGGGSVPTVGSQVSFGNTVSPYAYGAKGGVKYVYDLGFTNTLNTVTCANNDCGWTSADVNKIFFGTSQSNIGSQIGVGLITPQTTILSVQSTTAMTMNANASATCVAATTVLCDGAWGAQDDTTAINNSAAAAWGTSNPGKCQAVEIPSDVFFFSAPIASIQGPALSSACGGWTSSSSTSGVDTTQTGPEMYGQGPGNSGFIPLPSYSFTGCTTGDGNHSCNFTTPNLELHDLFINGLGQTLSGTPEAVNLVDLVSSTGGGVCTGTTGFNLTFAGWAVKSTGSVGFAAGNGCGDPYYANITVEQFGNNNCLFQSGGLSSYYSVMCFGAPNFPVSISCSNGTNIVNTFGGTYTDQIGGAATASQTGCQWNSTGEAIQLGTGGGGIIYENAGVAAVAYLTGDNIGSLTSTTGNEYFLLNPSVPGTVIHVKNTQFGGGGALAQFFSSNLAQPVKYFDDGGNNYGTLPGTASTFSGDIIADGHSAKGLGTGSCTASSTLGLRVSGSGTTTGGTALVTACTNSTLLDAGLPSPGARTLALFQCKVKVAGTTSSTCTVLVNGSASAITCTLAAAATSCLDTVHSVALADGDLVSLQIVTGAATTPSGVTAIATWQ